MGKIITADIVYLFRILLAIFAGAVIGYEREYHVKVAGLRTHILISMASALMMIISKYAFFDVLSMTEYSGLGLDVSRVAAGIIAGMGIFSGGIVFIGKRGNVSGLTTAAGIWATIGIGMVIGAGMYVVGIGSVVLVELVQLILRHDLPVYRHRTAATIEFVLDTGDDYDRIIRELGAFDVKLSSIRWEKNTASGTISGEQLNQCLLKVSAAFGSKYNRDEIVGILSNMDDLKSFELP